MVSGKWLHILTTGQATPILGWQALRGQTTQFLTNFQLASTSDYPGGLRGRLNPTTGASYGVWIYPAEGTIRLFRIGQWNIDSGNTLLATVAGLTVDTKVHNIRLSFKGSTIQVYYDNALVITATDSTYAQGAVALDVSNQPISFSNVSVISCLRNVVAQRVVIR